MGQCHVAARNARAVEIVDIAQACLLFNQLTLSSVFRGMRVNHHSARPGKLGDFFKQLARVTNREARRETVPDASIGLPVPSFQELERFCDRLRRLLLQSLRYFSALIHHALANRCAKTSLLDDFEDLLRGYGIVELQRTGRVALPKLDREARLRAANTNTKKSDYGKAG